MEEMTYTIIGPDGQMGYVWAKTMFEAYQEALAEYGKGAMVRPSWYGEWDCGMYKPGQSCGHDKYGNHIKAGELVGR